MTVSAMRSAEAIGLFSSYLQVTGVAHLGPEPSGAPELLGKRLGLLNGSSWITLWANYFGRLYLPGVHLVNLGNEAVQLSFMEAHERGRPCPPEPNIAAFERYAVDLVELGGVDAVLITCSTMNRSYPRVEAALEPYGVPVVQIDSPMMEEAVAQGGRVLVIATHGPTVRSTQELLCETAASQGKQVAFAGVSVPEAWERLAAGDVTGHNQALAQGIRAGVQSGEIGCVVLAQLSMSVLLLSYPDPVAAFGVPVLTSGEWGFRYVGRLLSGL